jgi:tetratricopeptide (TPR) repeat protein
MRAYVFTDRALERHAGRFVWLSIDAEKEVNAGFLEKYPIVGYPTFLVIDPAKETAAYRQLGGFPASAFGTILDDAEKALREGGKTDPESLIAEANRLQAADKDAEAAAAYRRALDGAPPGWAERERVIESYLGALSSAEKYDECVTTARAELPKTRTMHYAGVASYGLDCALSLEGDAKTKAVAEFEPLVRDVVEDRSLTMSGDDRSSLYLILWGARKDAGDADAAKRVAGEWLDFLDAEAAKAPNARARAVFDSHRLMAAIEAGVPERAIAFLAESEKSLPGDYNPPARLAAAYKAADRLDEALAAADRALVLAYGPRKIRVYSTKADILEEDGKIDEAKRTMEEAIRYAEGLPRAQASERTIESLKTKLAKIGTKPPVG